MYLNFLAKFLQLYFYLNFLLKSFSHPPKICLVSIYLIPTWSYAVKLDMDLVILSKLRLTLENVFLVGVLHSLFIYVSVTFSLPLALVIK